MEFLVNLDDNFLSILQDRSEGGRKFHCIDILYLFCSSKLDRADERVRSLRIAGDGASLVISWEQSPLK